ncbi:MAG: hypothetical protein V3R83_13345 [Gammaproteobacteria bacterium]
MIVIKPASSRRAFDGCIIREAFKHALKGDILSVAGGVGSSRGSKMVTSTGVLFAF